MLPSPPRPSGLSTWRGRIHTAGRNWKARLTCSLSRCRSQPSLRAKSEGRGQAGPGLGRSGGRGLWKARPGRPSRPSLPWDVLLFLLECLSLSALGLGVLGVAWRETGLNRSIQAPTRRGAEVRRGRGHPRAREGSRTRTAWLLSSLGAFAQRHPRRWFPGRTRGTHCVGKRPGNARGTTEER